MKKKLRKRLLKRRDAIVRGQKKLKDRAVEKRLFALNVFREAKSVLMYVSFRSEVNTRAMLRRVMGSQKKLVLPRVDAPGRTIQLCETRDFSELAPGYMGILEPECGEDRKVSLKQVDLVIIPGVGFDLRGYRLGYGGGYYDRLLSYEARRLGRGSRHITTIALAYEEQIGDKIPAEPHDIRVDMIVTDRRLILCGVPHNEGTV